MISDYNDDLKRDAVHYLQRRAECMNYEVIWLRGRIQELLSLKYMHEAKLQELEVDLTRRDIALDQAQRDYAQLKFESEESQLSIKELKAHIEHMTPKSELLHEDQSAPLKKTKQEATLKASYTIDESMNRSIVDKENIQGCTQSNREHLHSSPQKNIECVTPSLSSKPLMVHSKLLSPDVPQIKAASLFTHSCPQQ
jgi:hypothetical protein